MTFERYLKRLPFKCSPAYKMGEHAYAEGVRDLRENPFLVAHQRGILSTMNAVNIQWWCDGFYDAFLRDMGQEYFPDDMGGMTVESILRDRNRRVK